MKHMRGFSMIEVVIVIFISAVVMIALANIYITYSSSYAFQNASINGSASAAQFLNELTDLAHQSDAIVSSRAFSGTTYTTSSTTVIFEIPSINSSGDIVSNTYDYAVLYASSTSAYRIMDANASSVRVDQTKKYGDTVSNLTLTYDNGTPSSASAVTANITTQTTVKLEIVRTNLRQQVYLRNK